MWVAVVVAAVVGLVVGVVLGRRIRARTPAPVVPAAPAPRDPHDPVAVVLREAVNHLNIGVLVSNPKGAIVYRNRSSEALSGTHAGLVLDDHLKRLMDRARAGERVDEQLELHGPPRRSMMLVAEPMPNGAAVATVQDVSERVRIDAMRTDFVANISHELKTPVGAIAVLAEALIDETDVAVVHRIASRMTNESHRAVSAIDDLLELSWIESASATDEIVDLQRVVQLAISRGREAQSGRRIRVNCLEPAQPVRLRADGRQLVSALGNLVENAVKYSKDTGVVQVRTRIDDNAVEVMVVDQGVGIPQRDLNRIFERFYRVDKGRSRETGGTGLGLAIVRHVASNHGGEVQVFSREGEGSTFVLRLPASLIVDEVDDAVPVEAKPDDAGPAVAERADAKRADSMSDDSAPGDGDAIDPDPVVEGTADSASTDDGSLDHGPTAERQESTAQTAAARAEETGDQRE